MKGLILSLFSLNLVWAADDMPSQKEMWRIIQQQQNQIEALQKKLQQTQAQSDALVE